jgi:predicted short-subunit dehydrogenase-like oxidoreductase (DUF2520 family)
MNHISFIGAGRVAQTLSLALLQAGWPVNTVASRSAESASRLASRLPGAHASSITEAAQCDLVFLTVPDDAIAELAESLPWRQGQCVLHCSGATEMSVLDPAVRCGALTGSFHPLQIFSDPVSAAQHLRGSSVAIEGADALREELSAMAHAMGMHPIQLPAGARALYHAAASYAASMLLPLLDEAVQLWSHLGIDEAQTLRALLPLARGTLEAVENRGLAGALAGPVSRGDVAVVRKHLHALEGLAPSHGEIYRMLTKRQLLLAQRSSRLSDGQVQDLLNIVRSD